MREGVSYATGTRLYKPRQIGIVMRDHIPLQYEPTDKVSFV
jgi:hypothetical protein